MKIVTGHNGEDHITSNDFQGLNQGIVGTGNVIFDIGNCFNAVLTDSTHINVYDGEGMMQGVHFRTEPGHIDTITITSGVSEYNRIDLIVARYTKNQETAVEKVELVVIQGTAVQGTATDPEYNTGDILGGDTIVDFPLWRVSFAGLSPTLTQIFSKVTSIEKRSALLWENPLPDEVSSLEISVGLSDYNHIDVMYVDVRTGSTFATVQPHAIGYSGSATSEEVTSTGVLSSAVLDVYARPITVTNSAITWGACRNIHISQSGVNIGTENRALIPYRVYGVRY